MWKKRLLILGALLGTMAMLLTGCSNERKENEEAFRQAGINEMEAGNYNEAVTNFNNALAQHIGHITVDEIDISYYKAAAQFAGADLQGAVDTYTAIIAYDKKAAEAYFMRGCVYLQQGQSLEQVQTDFKQAVACNSSDYELYDAIYQNLDASGYTEEGKQFLNDAFSIKGNSAENLAWRGKFYYLMGEYDNAIEELNAAIEKESTIAVLYLAQTYDAQGDTASAQANYQSYLSSGAADSVALNALGVIELEKGNYSGAISYFNQGLALENITNQKDLLYNKIIASEYSGDFASAKAAMDQYLVLAPEDAAALRESTFLNTR